MVQSIPNKALNADNQTQQEEELRERIRAADLITSTGRRLRLGRLAINTAIVYMHRFYKIQSFKNFPCNRIAPAAIFLAAKVVDEHRKLEDFIKQAHLNEHKEAPQKGTEAYQHESDKVSYHEQRLLETLGFNLNIKHPDSNFADSFQRIDGKFCLE